MRTKEEIHKYWKNPNDKNNNPECYLDNEITLLRSKYLFEVIDKYFPSKETKILELGSNVGRNLNYLFERGYKNLLGIEINKNAIDIMKKEYPDCAKEIRIINNPIEHILSQLTDNQFDLIFTFAVLEHIHPESEFVFSEMVRASKNILVVEDEKSSSWRHCPRNYKEIFGKSMREVHSQKCGKFNGLSKRFTTRLFAKEN